MSRWQPGLKSFEHVSGEPGRPGAVSKLTYLEDGRQVVLTETIKRRVEGEALDGTYTAPGVVNHIRNTFIEVSPNETRWQMEAEFVFQNFFMRLLGPLMKGAFVKRTQDDMQRFKQVAEGS